MIFGIGTDLIEIERIKKAIKNENFKNKIYTKKELQLLAKKGNNAINFAGKFAAKEAVAKALCTGFKNFEFKDIEILNDENGMPFPTLYNKAKDHLGKKRIFLTISHSKENAIATVVIDE